MLNTLERSRTDPDQIVFHRMALHPIDNPALQLGCFWPNWPEGGNTPPFEVVRGPLVLPGLERSYEIITPNSDGFREKWKSFQHFKRSIDSFPHEPTALFTTDVAIPYYPNDCGNYNGTLPSQDPQGSLARVAWYSGSGTPGTFRPWEMGGVPKLFDPTTDEGTAFVPAPAELGALQQAALQSVMPVIKAELSLVNTLIELKDVKTLLHSANTLIDELILPLLLKLRHGRAVYGNTLSGLLRAVSDSYLQYKFNIAPALSDIAGLQRAMSKVEKRLRTLINESLELQAKHFKYRWREHPNNTTTSAEYQLSGGNYYPAINGCVSKTEVFNDSSEFNVTVRYQYDWPVLRGWHAGLLALLDSVGVNLNPQIVWNAIPWSFVVDWVANVGHFLSQFTIHNIEPKINIRNYCWSIKRRRVFYSNLIVGKNPIGLPYWPSGISMPTVTETAYRRVVTWPSYSWIQTSGLSPTEVTLGAALAFVRKPHYKRNSR
jgi:hypothetical protein